MEHCFDRIKENDLRPIREIVLESLRKAIFENRLKPGDRLVETSIAEAMGVSRTPVREALRQLELEGLATNLPRKGTVVNGISVEKALEMYDIREVLEGLAARLACINIPIKKLRHLKKIVENMNLSIENKDNDLLFALHEEWNEALLTLSQNETLEKEMRGLYEHLGRLRVVSLYDMNFQKQAKLEYENILAAIEEGNETKAEEYAKEHVRKAKSRFIHIVNNMNNR